MKKKIIAVLLIAVTVLTLCGILSACNKDEAADNSITIWAGGQWTGTDLQNLKAFVKNYNETNTLGLTVEVVAKSDMETALATSVRNNKVPDILIWDRFNTPTYSKTDALLDISEYIQRDNIDVNLFNGQAMTELTYNSKYYGLPLDLDVWGTYVNMDMVNAYNESHTDDIVLSDTWTWEEMYAVAEKLTKIEGGQMKVAGYSGHVMHQHYFKYLTSAGQDFFKADGTPNFDTAQSRDVLNFFKKVGSDGNHVIWENGLVEKSNFTSETLAMIDQSLYFTDYIERYNSTMNYKFMPQPRYAKEGGVNGGMLGGFGIAFPKPAKKFLTDNFYARFEVAWKFAKDWLLNEELQTKWSQATGTLPALKSLYTSSTVLTNETLVRAASFVDNYKIRPQVPGYLTMQTSVIDTGIKAFTEGTRSLDATINDLIEGCQSYME